jgi:leader peptidase (prepilin peptidase)/N-methyltransferase
MITLVFVLLGLTVGSFINVLVDRTHAKKQFIAGRSVCDHCQQPLEPVDLVPVLSWVALGGKCRQCRKPISVQYPLVELLTGVAFGLSYAYWPEELVGVWAQSLFGLWLVGLVLMVALLVYDIKWLALPDRFIWPLVLAALMGTIVAARGDISLIGDRLLGAAWVYGFFAALYYGSRGRWLGGGDVKFGLAIGLWLGALKALVALVLAFYSATILVVVLLAAKRVTKKTPIPFGPFLIVGLIFAQLYGAQAIDWYHRVFLPL